MSHVQFSRVALYLVELSRDLFGSVAFGQVRSGCVLLSRVKFWQTSRVLFGSVLLGLVRFGPVALRSVVFC